MSLVRLVVFLEHVLLCLHDGSPLHWRDFRRCLGWQPLHRRVEEQLAAVHVDVDLPVLDLLWVDCHAELVVAEAPQQALAFL